jgi:hypothetical protein
MTDIAPKQPRNADVLTKDGQFNQQHSRWWDGVARRAYSAIRAFANLSASSDIDSAADYLIVQDTSANTTVKALIEDVVPAQVNETIETTVVSGALDTTVTLPGGYIIRVGFRSSTVDTAEVFTFNEAFPNNCYGVFTQRSSAGASSILAVTTFTTTTFTVDRANTINGSVDFQYVAFGR